MFGKKKRKTLAAEATSPELRTDITLAAEATSPELRTDKKKEGAIHEATSHYETSAAAKASTEATADEAAETKAAAFEATADEASEINAAAHEATAEEAAGAEAAETKAAATEGVAAKTAAVEEAAAKAAAIEAADKGGAGVVEDEFSNEEFKMPALREEAIGETQSRESGSATAAAEEEATEEAPIRESGSAMAQAGEAATEEAPIMESGSDRAHQEEGFAMAAAGEDRGVGGLEEAYCLGAGIDREALFEAKAKLAEIAEAVGSKAFNPELIHLGIKIMNFDRLLDEAREEGRREVREERVAEAFRNRRSKAHEAASLPHLRGSKGLGAFNGDSIFDIARNAY